MRFKYGSYTHADFEANLVIDKERPRAASGVPSAEIQRWTISGVLQAESFSELTNKIREMERAYENENVDCGLYTVTNQATAHVIQAGRVEYVRVTKPPSYPEGSGAEYVLQRSYSLQIEIRLPAPSSGNDDLDSWRETISITGDGGPIVKYAPVIDGPWIPQVVNSRSMVTISQRGSARGRNRYPIHPQPVMPGNIIRPGGLQKEYTSPDSLKPAKGFEISWNYQMESQFVPNVLPGYPRL